MDFNQTKSVYFFEFEFTKVNSQKLGDTSKIE